MSWCSRYILLGAVMLCGCERTFFEPPDIDIEAQWVDAMRRLNMYGFYPANEDVQIGDIFLYAPPADRRRSAARFSLIRLGSLPVGRATDRGAPPDYENMGIFDHIEAQQRWDRLRIAPYPSPNPRNPESAAAPGTSVTRTTANATGMETSTTYTPSPTTDAARRAEDAAKKAAEAAARAEAAGRVPRRGSAPTPAPREYNLRAAQDISGDPRLRLATMPSMAAGRLTYAQLGAAGIIGNLGARLGIAQANQTAVSVALRNMQELQVDAWRVRTVLDERLDEALSRIRVEDLFMQLQQLRGELVVPACQGNADLLDSNNVKIEVINRVLYAGSIEYSFSRNAETALRLAVDLQNSLAPRVPAQIPSLGAVTLPSGASGYAAAPEAATAAGARLASLMSGITGESGGAGRAGVTASFGIGTFGALSLSQDYARPIAVAAGSRISVPFHAMLAGFTAADQQQWRIDRSPSQDQRPGGRRGLDANPPPPETTWRLPYYAHRLRIALRHCRYLVTTPDYDEGGFMNLVRAVVPRSLFAAFVTRVGSEAAPRENTGSSGPSNTPDRVSPLDAFLTGIDRLELECRNPVGQPICGRRVWSQDSSGRTDRSQSSTQDTSAGLDREPRPGLRTVPGGPRL